MPDPNFPRVWSPFQYFELFTESEVDALLAARKTHPIVDKIMFRWTLAMHIDIEDPRVVQGMNALVSLGLLTAARRDYLLNL